jgi:hypothetical protein
MKNPHPGIELSAFFGIRIKSCNNFQLASLAVDVAFVVGFKGISLGANSPVVVS